MRGKKNTVKKEEPEERPKSILGNKYKTKKLGKAVRAICPKCGRSYTSHYRVCPVCIGKEQRKDVALVHASGAKLPTW